MSQFLPSIFASLWLGILTSISPCPLASNIAAISFISQRFSNKKIILFSSFLYILGRSIAYIIIAFLIIKISINIPNFSMFLQIHLNKILAFLLILVGLILLNIIKIPSIGLNISEENRKNIDRFGLFGSLFLGILFAFSFCPVSAALFFGSLIPISISSNSIFFLPLTYGIGTALPIFIFSVLLFFSIELVEKAYHNLKRVEFYGRKITGIVFILIGIYYVLAYLFKII